MTESDLPQRGDAQKVEALTPVQKVEAILAGSGIYTSRDFIFRYTKIDPEDLETEEKAAIDLLLSDQRIHVEVHPEFGDQYQMLPDHSPEALRGLKVTRPDVAAFLSNYWKKQLFGDKDPSEV